MCFMIYASFSLTRLGSYPRAGAGSCSFQHLRQNGQDMADQVSAEVTSFRTRQLFSPGLVLGLWKGEWSGISAGTGSGILPLLKNCFPSGADAHDSAPGATGHPGIEGADGARPRASRVRWRAGLNLSTSQGSPFRSPAAVSSSHSAKLYSVMF